MRTHKGVKGADGRALGLSESRFGFRFAWFRDELSHALLHFAGGFVRERHAEDVSRRNSALNHVGNAEGDDARFARAGAGQNQDRPLQRLGGEALLRIERTEIQHRDEVYGAEKISEQEQTRIVKNFFANGNLTNGFCSTQPLAKPQILRMDKRSLTLGHSPDPDDAFMFYGLAKELIPTHGFQFEHILQDIQTLNERATRGELDISAVSIHAYAYVSDKYALLPSGASMGDGYGPMLVAKEKFSHEEIARKKDRGARHDDQRVSGVATMAGETGEGIQLHCRAVRPDFRHGPFGAADVGLDHSRRPVDVSE